MAKRLTEFEKVFCQGYACAVANLIRLHGDSTEAEDTYKQNYLSISELKSRGIEEYDIKILTPMIRSINKRRKQFSHSE